MELPKIKKDSRIPEGTILFCPPRLTHETDEEYAARCTAIVNIGKQLPKGFKIAND